MARTDQGSVTARDAGSCWVEVGSWSYPALAAWLLLFEADFEVLEPVELGAALDTIARRIDRAATASR
jgi:hypothetical protein